MLCPREHGESNDIHFTRTSGWADREQQQTHRHRGDAIGLLCLAAHVDLPLAIACGTVGSLVSLIATEPRKPRPTMGRQLYRTTQYLITNLAPMVDSAAHTPCILFAFGVDEFDLWCKRNSK